MVPFGANNPANLLLSMWYDPIYIESDTGVTVIEGPGC